LINMWGERMGTRASGPSAEGEPVRVVVDPAGAGPGGAGLVVAMPARRSSWPRVQLNTRVRVEVEQLLQRFVIDHNTTVQNSVDLALTEFLTARGYPLAAPGDRSLS
jgi:hypothetical protein